MSAHHLERSKIGDSWSNTIITPCDKAIKGKCEHFLTHGTRYKYLNASIRDCIKHHVVPCFSTAVTSECQADTDTGTVPSPSFLLCLFSSFDIAQFLSGVLEAIDQDDASSGSFSPGRPHPPRWWTPLAEGPRDTSTSARSLCVCVCVCVLSCVPYMASRCCVSSVFLVFHI